MPFRKEFYSRFLCIKKCGEQVGLTVYRVDRYRFSGNIIEAISKAIAKADFVVADLTGNNPNVMYELAISQSLGKRVLMVGDGRSSMPFENSSYLVEVLDPAVPEHGDRLVAAMKDLLRSANVAAIHGERVLYHENLFLPRLAAFAIDLAPFMAAYVVAYFLVGIDTLLAKVVGVSIFCVMWIYFTLTTWALGYTGGKRWMGLKVTNFAGEKPSFAQAAGRSALSLVTLPFWAMSHFAALRPPAYRAGHDATMKTTVRRLKDA